MSYNNAIPQPTDIISNSQANLLANFQAIDSGTTGTGIGFSVNHITMDDVDHPGMHDLVELPEVQSVDPTPDSDNYSAIYSKTGTTYAEPYFINNDVSASVIWYGGIGNGGASSTASTSGQLNLPNGIQFRWGTGTVTSSGSATAITFTPAFSTACFNVQVTCRAASNSINAIVDLNTALTASGFSARGTNSPTNFYYFAVGN